MPERVTRVLSVVQPRADIERVVNVGHGVPDRCVHHAAVCVGQTELPLESDDRFLGADSIELLREVTRVIREHGYTVGNVDCTVIAQRPKLAPYIQQMREILAQAMGTELDRVSVKATTEEKLGFTGEGLGIAAHAVALIE